MKVSSSDYRIITLKKALLLYVAAMISIFVPFYFLSFVFESNHVFWNYVFLLFWLVIGLTGMYGIKYGNLTVKFKQYPPPNTWVISNWNVCFGRKAYWFGQSLKVLSLIILAQSMYLIYFIIKVYL